MAQFACYTVCTRPRRTVHPHCEPHPRTEIGCQNQLLRKAVSTSQESCRLTSRENSTGQFSVFSSLSARSYKSAAVNGGLGVEIMVRLSLPTSAGNPSPDRQRALKRLVARQSFRGYLTPGREHNPFCGPLFFRSVAFHLLLSQTKADMRCPISTPATTLCCFCMRLYSLLQPESARSQFSMRRRYFPHD